MRYPPLAACRSWQRPEAWWELELVALDSVVGEYVIGGSSGLRGTARFVAPTACDDVAPYLDAVSGRIAFDAVAEELAGSFEVVFAEGEASGTFTAHLCDEEPAGVCEVAF